MQKILSETSGRARITEKSITLTATSETLVVDLFTLTGSVLIHKIWAEVTTIIGANHTNGFLRLDAAAATPITLDGAALSGLAVGTMMIKEGLVAVVLTVLDNATQDFEEPAAAGDPAFQPFIVTKKTAVATHIDYSYATTDAPTSGALKWKVQWEPLSDDGALAAA